MYIPFAVAGTRLLPVWEVYWSSYLGFDQQVPRNKLYVLYWQLPYILCNGSYLSPEHNFETNLGCEALLTEFWKKWFHIFDICGQYWGFYRTALWLLIDSLVEWKSVCSLEVFIYLVGGLAKLPCTGSHQSLYVVFPDMAKEGGQISPEAYIATMALSFMISKCGIDISFIHIADSVWILQKPRMYSHIARACKPSGPGSAGVQKLAHEPPQRFFNRSVDFSCSLKIGIRGS